jgi:hypothetical protein
VRRFAVFAASLVVLLGLAYGAGWLRVSGKVAVADDAARAAAASASARQVELTRTEQRLAVLEARRHLDLAELALDARNFGTAEKYLHAAGALLGGEGHAQELSALGRTLASAHLVATEDLGADRLRVAGWIRRFDELVPPPPLN